MRWKKRKKILLHTCGEQKRDGFTRLPIGWKERKFAWKPIEVEQNIYWVRHLLAAIEMWACKSFLKTNFLDFNFFSHDYLLLKFKFIDNVFCWNNIKIWNVTRNDPKKIINVNQIKDNFYFINRIDAWHTQQWYKNWVGR